MKRKSYRPKRRQKRLKPKALVQLNGRIRLLTLAKLHFLKAHPTGPVLKAALKDKQNAMHPDGRIKHNWLLDFALRRILRIPRTPEAWKDFHQLYLYHRDQRSRWHNEYLTRRGFQRKGLVPPGRRFEAAARPTLPPAPADPLPPSLSPVNPLGELSP